MAREGPGQPAYDIFSIERMEGGIWELGVNFWVAKCVFCCTFGFLKC